MRPSPAACPRPQPSAARSRALRHNPRSRRPDAGSPRPWRFAAPREPPTARPSPAAESRSPQTRPASAAPGSGAARPEGTARRPSMPPGHDRPPPADPAPHRFAPVLRRPPSAEAPEKAARSARRPRRAARTCAPPDASAPASRARAAEAPCGPTRASEWPARACSAPARNHPRPPPRTAARFFDGSSIPKWISWWFLPQIERYLQYSPASVTLFHDCHARFACATRPSLWLA